MLCGLPKFSDENLLVGFEDSDDAAVYKVSDDVAVIQTVDIFPPVVDDPFAYGQIAAANALSDVYAMGGKPKLALNICCLPDDLPRVVMKTVLKGAYSKVQESGAVIAGGHTIKDRELKYGLAVTGFSAPEKILTNGGAAFGDALVLTKPIGTGVLTTVAKAGMLSDETMQIMVESMARLNRYAAEIMEEYDVHSCTDITGFGLAGHLFEMADASDCTICIDHDHVPLLPEAEEYTSMGLIPAGAYRNREYIQEHVKIEETTDLPLEWEDLFYDPQTSGGLLISLPADQAEEMVIRMKKAGEKAAVIGNVIEKEKHSLFIR